MSTNYLTASDLMLLREPTFQLPRVRDGSASFEAFLAGTFAEFLARLGQFDEPLRWVLAERQDRIVGLSDALLSALRQACDGDDSQALTTLDGGLRGVYSEIISMSRRHSAKVLSGQSWYRLAAWPGVNARVHMFHSPFEKPQRSYRFSTPGAPTLYLANSVYLCWLECGKPDVDRCYVSRFEIDTSGRDFLDLPCSHQAYLDPLEGATMIPDDPIHPSTWLNSPYREDVVVELAEYLTLWPLLAAIATRRFGETEVPPEYVISQLLMRWVKDSQDFLGIRYFTTKDDPAMSSGDWSINLALPTRTTKPSGYCDVLAAWVQCTDPKPLGSMRDISLAQLRSKTAVGLREAHRGRIALSRDNTYQNYADTIFGKMEYWLERPEHPVGRIGLTSE